MDVPSYQENAKLREIFHVTWKYNFLGFSIITLLNKMVHVMQGVVTPPNHILDANQNLKVEVKEAKFFITSILSKLWASDCTVNVKNIKI